MTREEFEKVIWDEVAMCPKCWRKGQSVFNVVNELFGVARSVQFEDGVDCFYDDDAIGLFIDKSWIRYYEKITN